jgi:hypothetical protein
MNYFRGELEDLDSLRRGTANIDAVVNLAFSHDFSKFAQNAEDERQAMAALGSVLDPGRLLVVTSGTGLANGGRSAARDRGDPRRRAESPGDFNAGLDMPASSEA